MEYSAQKDKKEDGRLLHLQSASVFLLSDIQ